VPPTGIPRPDREDAPPAGFGPAGFGPAGFGPAVGAVLMGLVLLAPSLTATTALANTSSGTGITWQPGHGVGITPVLDAPVLDVATVADGRPAQTGGAAINHQSPEQIRQTSWSARPVHTSQSQSGQSQSGQSQSGQSQSGQSQSGQSQSGQLQAGEKGDDATHATVLPVKLRQAILLDPRVAEMSARACQMAHRLGLARAEGRPKVTASVTGSRQLVGRIKKQPQRSVFNPETRRRE
jgi:hypothetical protein